MFSTSAIRPLRSLFGAAFAALVLAGTASAAEGSIRWKLHKGDRFFTEEVGKFKVELGGQAGTMEVTIRMVNEMNVLKAANGEVVVEQTIRVFDCSMPIPKDIRDGVVGAKFQLTFGPNMVLKQFDGYEDFLTRASSGSPALRREMAQAMSEKQIRRAISEVFSLYVPRYPVQAGKSWQGTRDLELPGEGPVTMAVTFTPGSVTNVDGRSVQKYAYTGTAKTSPAVKIEDFGGEVQFDHTTGRLVSVEMHGNVTFSIQGETGKVELSQTIRVHDEQPK